MTSARRRPSPPNDELDAIGRRLAAARSAHSIRAKAALAALGVAIACGSIASQSARESRERQQGADEALAAMAATRGALAYWNPQRGYGQLAGRSLEGLSAWGSKSSQLVAPGGSGVLARYSFASKRQCEGLLSASQAFFERAAVDGKPAPNDDPAAACSDLGQNEILLTKLDPRASAFALDAGRRDETAGGLVPGVASPATPAQLAAARPPPAPPSSARPPAAPAQP